MTQKTDKSHQVSLKRPDGWYSADNEMVTVFAPLIGPYAFSVYHLLKQRAFLKEKERAISLVEIGKALGMSKEAARAAIATLREFGLVEMQSSKAANKAPHYEVVHAKDVLGLQATSSLQENTQFPHLQAISRTLAKPNRERDIADVEGDKSPVSRRDSGHRKATSRLPNKEEVLKEKVQEQDIPTLPSPGEGVHKPIEEQDCETKNEAAMAVGVVRSCDEVEPAAEVPLAVRDADGRGPVDRRGDTAVECDAPTKPQTSPVTTAGARLAADGLTPVKDTLAGMLRDLKAEKPEPAEDRTPRERATFFLQYLHQQFSDAFTVQKPGTDWEDPYAAWMRCFDHVRVGDVEADGNQMVVLLETPKPKDLVAGLTKYRAKVQLAMKKAFGREVQLVPRLEAA